MKPQASKIRSLPVAELQFDWQDPRLAEFQVGESTTEGDMLQLLWDNMDIKELIMSMSASGFFPHEALLAVEENGRYVVIEGNRRLAALKILLERGKIDTPWEFPRLEVSRAELDEVPVITTTREDSWRFLAFKHINGAVKWSSVAKAEYIANVHRRYGKPLREIAVQIGDRFGTVTKLYQAYTALEQAEEAEVFNREDRHFRYFAFSHFYAALGYEGFRGYLGLSAEPLPSGKPVPDDKVRRLGEVLAWLYGSKARQREPVVKSQNPHHRQLDAVLRNPTAIQCLRDEGRLELAFAATMPAAERLSEALYRAKRELQEAKAQLVGGYDGQGDLLRVVGSIANLADSSYEEMDGLRGGGKPRKRLAE